MFLATSFTVCLLIVTIFVWLIVRRKFYWSRKNIHGPAYWFPFQEIFSELLKPKHETQYENYIKYNKVWGTHGGLNQNILVVGEPDLIQKILVRDFSNFKSLGICKLVNEIESDVLVTLEGAKWKRVRTIVATTFTSQKLKLIFELMKNCNKIGFDELRKMCQTSHKFDPKTFWGQYTIDLIAKCCFATDLNTFESPDNIFYKHCESFFKFRLSTVIIFFNLLPQRVINYLKLSLGKETVSFFSQIIRHILKSREDNPSLKVNDYIQLLADSQSDEVVDEKDHNGNLKRKLTENEVIANCIMFILAGYETSSSLLAFACYELAKHSQIQERLYNEVNSVDIEDYDQLNKLEFLNAVINETIRLYPSATSLIRRSFKCQLNESIALDDGTKIEIPTYSIHRDPDNYENPNTFDPDRFMPPRIDQIKPYTFFPFGGGPRTCMGMRFSILNAKLALATLIKNFRVYDIIETPQMPTFTRFSWPITPENFTIGISLRN